jgi:hypothetical protein
VGLVEPITEDAMVAAWLLAELNSSRWEWCIQDGLASEPESIVRSPNLADARENTLRASILGKCRGWRIGTMMFPGFPVDATEWHRAELDLPDTLAVRGSLWEPWGALASPTRTVGAAVEKVMSGTYPAAARELVENARSIERRYRVGEDLGQPILAGRPSGPPRVALEGHTRLLGWALAERSDPFEVIVGLSDRISEWRRFG